MTQGREEAMTSALGHDDSIVVHDPGRSASRERCGRKQASVRLLARLVDLVLVVLCVFAFCELLSAWIPRLERGTLRGLVVCARLAILLLAPLLWGTLEALALSRWGTTPGKAIFNLAVRCSDGRRLSFAEAFGRFTRVLAGGLFFGCLPLMPITLALSYRAVTLRGGTFWDGGGSGEERRSHHE